MALEQITKATFNSLIELNVPGLQNYIENIFATYSGDKMWTSLYYKEYYLCCNKNDFTLSNPGLY